MDRRDVLGLLRATADGLAAGTIIPRAVGAEEAHDMTPLDAFHLHLCVFHIAKKFPNFQVEAHHYCSMVNDEVDPIV